LIIVTGTTFEFHQMLTARIKETIRRHGMLKNGDRVVVAVSGGPDSVCLLSALRALSGDLGITLHVAHLDHQFRGAESAEEARFVEKLTEKLVIPVTIEKIDVPAYCREKGLSAQSGAREVRYAFLERIARATGACRIATGHTATDQAETFLMRLIRGAAGSGLSSIPPVRGTIIRPLIDSTRVEVMEYLRTAELPFVTDSSNAKPVYMRNRIRMDVLPVLKNFNPRIIETLATEASLLRDDDTALQAGLDAILPAVCAQEPECVVIRRTEFNVQLPALRRRIIKRAAGMAGLDASRLSASRIEETLSFIAEAHSGRAMDLASGLKLVREYDRFLITATAEAGFMNRSLSVPGLTTVPEFGLEIEIEPEHVGAESQSDKNYRWQAAFDYDNIDAPLVVRNRLPGDQFCPSGMGGRHKKLHDFFIDEKVPRLQRDRIPLICAGENILWVVGFRTDERFTANDRAKQRLMVRIR
jgi:tRNA(Ile)-lysidine synthase